MARTDPHPELNPSQRLLRVVFGYDYHSFPPQPMINDYAVDEVAVWEFIDEVLSEREALVLKYHFGQVGRTHTMKEIARILPRTSSRGFGVKRCEVGRIEREALGTLRYSQARMIVHLAKGSCREVPAPVASDGLSPGSLKDVVKTNVEAAPPRVTRAEPSSCQRLLTTVYGLRWDDPNNEINPYPAADEVGVWRLVDAVLTEREAFVLKCRCGQVGGSHTLDETAHILPRGDRAGIGVNRERVRQIEAKALRKLRHPLRGKWLRRLAESKPIDWSLIEAELHGEPEQQEEDDDEVYGEPEAEEEAGRVGRVKRNPPALP